MITVDCIVDEYDGNNNIQYSTTNNIWSLYFTM